MKNAILIFLIARYESKAYTHTYIFGFIYKGNVYAVVCNGLAFGIKLDRSSPKNGNCNIIRYSPTEAEKQAIIDSGRAEFICTEKDFLDMVASCKYNRGEVFEKIMTERTGQVWVKDKVPFYEGADLTVGNVAYSIKFQKATICTEATLDRIGA